MTRARNHPPDYIRCGNPACGRNLLAESYRADIPPELRPTASTASTPQASRIEPSCAARADTTRCTLTDKAKHCDPEKKPAKLRPDVAETTFRVMQ